MSRPGLEQRLISLLIVLTVLVVAPARTVEARYASIVIDSATGEVLEARNADDANRPASLAKMMTLYLAFQAMRQSWAGMEAVLPVSDRAAGQPPSKIGLVSGEQVTVRDLILALITKSANDAATTLAEGLAGSEPVFAERMTAMARQLGMSRTTFRNASGLPDPEQVTSARDLATLAHALWRDFPVEYRLFATEHFERQGTVYVNHNSLMAHFAGMDGIKTGYIRESGFNLVASAVRDGRRLIGVVMGGETAMARDAHMAQLLDDAFAGRSSEALVELAAQNDGVGAPIRRIIAVRSPSPPRIEAAAISTRDARGGQIRRVRTRSAVAPMKSRPLKVMSRTAKTVLRVGDGLRQ
jgi:D-alanyl-D-alanine carboxypeptidase